MADNEPVSASSMLNGASAQAAKTSTDVAEQYDLLPKMIPYFDRHLIFPLLEFLSGLEDEDSTRMLEIKFSLLQPTNMTDYVANLWKEIHNSDNIPPEFHKKREEVLQRLQRFADETSQIDELLNDESVTSNLRSDKVANLKFLEQQHGVTGAMVDQLYAYGRFQYDCGNYGQATHLLDQFRILSTDADRVNAATWGKLAADILRLDWASVMDEITKVKESIDTKLFNNPLAQLQHRTWLVHWVLFPLFNHEDEAARDTLTETLFSPPFINTIQTSCPWTLRYLVAAVIVGGRTGRGYGGRHNAHQKQLKDLVRVVRQEAYEYRDPVTDFVRALYVDFDFEEAQRRLGEAETLLHGDFFLVSGADAFVESARHLISESYCKIHQRIDIKCVPHVSPYCRARRFLAGAKLSPALHIPKYGLLTLHRDLSTRLGLGQDEGEKWIVNLIRDTRVDAKIDYKDGTVVMNHPPQSVYQQVIERTKGGFFRTQVLRYVY